MHIIAADEQVNKTKGVTYKTLSAGCHYRKTTVTFFIVSIQLVTPQQLIRSSLMMLAEWQRVIGLLGMPSTSLTVTLQAHTTRPKLAALINLIG